tara:strand:- start:20026 stop:20415 length:390 start_codon:yes stop_codon:yes gene_type:complete
MLSSEVVWGYYEKFRGRMVKKYTEEQTQYILEEYEKNPTQDTIERLVAELEFPKRSIIGKLSRIGVYKKEPYKPKYAEKPISKEELVDHLANQLGADSEKLAGLSKSQKPALLYLEEILVEAGYIESRE